MTSSLLRKVNTPMCRRPHRMAHLTLRKAILAAPGCRSRLNRHIPLATVCRLAIRASIPLHTAHTVRGHERPGEKDSARR